MTLMVLKALLRLLKKLRKSREISEGFADMHEEVKVQMKGYQEIVIK